MYNLQCVSGLSFYINIDISASNTPCSTARSCDEVKDPDSGNYTQARGETTKSSCLQQSFIWVRGIVSLS